MLRFSVFLSFVIAVAACGGDAEPLSAADAVLEPGDLAARASFDEVSATVAAAELKLQVDGLTVWLRGELKPERSAPQTRWILRGRTGGNLAEVRSYILGDGFGQATITGARSFAVAVDAHEINSLLSGLRLFVDLVPRSARAQPATVAIQLAPRWQMSRGDGSIQVGAEVRPVNVAGELLYRAEVTASGEGPLMAKASDGGVMTTQPRGQGAWSVDVPFAVLEREARSRATASFTLFGPAKVNRRADLAITVSAGDLFRGPAEARYPEAQSCAPEVQVCIDGLPAGDFDYGACGSYREVASCHLPSALPSLSLIEHEEVEGILEAAAAARAQRPDGPRIYANVYAVQGSSDDPPRPDQVTKAWLQAMGLGETLTSEPAVDLEAVRQEIDANGAGGLLGAAAEVYGDEAPTVALFRPRSSDALAHVLVCYPLAARLVAIDLVTQP